MNEHQSNRSRLFLIFITILRKLGKVIDGFCITPAKIIKAAVNRYPAALAEFEVMAMNAFNNLSAEITLDRIPFKLFYAVTHALLSFQQLIRICPIIDGRSFPTRSGAVSKISYEAFIITSANSIYLPKFAHLLRECEYSRSLDSKQSPY